MSSFLFCLSKKKQKRHGWKNHCGEDRFKVKLTKLKPAREIVMAINFDSADSRFTGEMQTQILFDEHTNGTSITFHFYNIPAGIRPEDNEAGKQQSSQKLARFVEQGNDKAHPKTNLPEIDEQVSDGSANAFEDK